MYICPMYMRCNAPKLFTCIAVLSRLVVKGGCIGEIWIVGTNNKLLGGLRQLRKIQFGRDWQEAQSNPRTRSRWTCSRGASRDSSSSMYKVYIAIFHMKRKDWDVTSQLYNLLFVLDYSSLYNLYDSLFMLDYLFSPEPLTCFHAWLFIFSAG
jgi:hypothetical protein